MAETDIRKTGIQRLKGLPGINRQPQYDAETDILSQIMETNLNAYLPENNREVGIAAAEAGYGNSQYDSAVTSENQFADLNEVRYAEQPWYDTLANGIGKMLGTAGTTFVSSLVGLPYGIGAAINEGRWSAIWDNDVTQGLAGVDNWLEENMTNYKSQQQQENPWYDPSNLFSMNFVADDIIKNAGFTLGAAASMAVGSGSLGLMGKALGFVNDVSKTTKGGAALLSALFSATGEGMIEARQGVEERNKREMQRLEDALTPEYQALDMQKQEIDQQYSATGDYQTYKNQMQDWLSQKQSLDNKKKEGQQQIIESGQDMGNTILLANQGLLTLGNLIQFGKGMAKSFDAARHAAETTSKVAKPFGVRAVAQGKNLGNKGYEITGKNFGRVMAGIKGPVTEGSEEMNQQWIQSGAGAYFTEEDVNDYWKAKLDPNSYRETTQGLYSFGQALDRGFKESWGDKDQWEQFVIGAFTGLAGSYTPTKLFNQDKTKAVWDPRRYGSWEGGAINAIKDFNKEYKQYEENINDVNKILQSEDFPSRVESMVAHTFMESQKTQAAESDDKKSWKDADDKQAIHDIQSFLRAGKLDDLRAIYEEIGADLSDEAVDNIIKSTSKEISAEEDKQNFDRQTDEQIGVHQRNVTRIQDEIDKLVEDRELLEGSDEIAAYTEVARPRIEELLAEQDKEKDAIDALEQQKQDYVGKGYTIAAYKDMDGNPMTREQVRDQVKHNAEELNRKLDSYLDSIREVQNDTGGKLTKDQEDNLAYLHNLSKESLVRADKIIADKRKQMPQKFLMKTDKTPEQLEKEYVGSDLVFKKEEDTKEGYVEVDTSLMDDRGFRNFFIGELLWGGNVDPEFSETAEEKAAREEEEKMLPEEERKKKTVERLSKKWKEGLKKRQEYAQEQREVNGDLIADYFTANYKKKNNASQAETMRALNTFFQDIVDAEALVGQSGQYDKTLREYMANPQKVDQAREKEAVKAQKAEEEQQAKNKFEGKSAKQMKQELADGVLDFDDFNDFTDMDISGDAPAPLSTAQQEAKKAKEGIQKANALKNHIQEQLGDTPTQEELDIAQKAMQKIDNALLETDEAADINLGALQIQAPIIGKDETFADASIDDIEEENQRAIDMIAVALNAFEEDQNATDDIPDTVPEGALDDVDMPTTGKDKAITTVPETAAPIISSPSTAVQNVVPQNPLTEGAVDDIIKATNSATTPPNTNGTWRSTTGRFGKTKIGDQWVITDKPYHELVTDKESVLYKRSKAIWEYFDREKVFDNQENASADRIKNKDTIHFMVKYLPEVFGARIEEVSDENKSQALVILMLDDNGRILGDLPLAEFEPSFRGGNPTQQVKDLKALQDKLFKAFLDYHAREGGNEAIVDSTLKMEGKGNLNLTFNNAKKTPLVSKVKQVMRGSVPYSKTEKNILNDVANGRPELAVKVTGDHAAVKRMDKNPHKEIILPGVGTIGQPYILIPSVSGEKIAVPFYMPAFDAEKHKNTELYKLLANAIYNLLVNNSQNTEAQKNSFMKHLDVVKGLLQVDKPDRGRIIEVGSNQVTLHLQSLTDANKKIDITLPIDGKDAGEMANLFTSQLSGIPINVSIQYLNSTIETVNEDKYTRDYNQVIGEIADVNLPKNTLHTVNGWFTVELSTQAGIKPTARITTKKYGVTTEVVGGRSIEFNLDVANITATDATTGEEIEDDETINLRRAQLRAQSMPGKDTIQIEIGGDVRTYDVKNNRFIRNTQKTEKKAAVVQQPTGQEVNGKSLDEYLDIIKPLPNKELNNGLDYGTASYIREKIKNGTSHTRKEYDNLSEKELRRRLDHEVNKIEEGRKWLAERRKESEGELGGDALRGPLTKIEVATINARQYLSALYKKQQEEEEMVGKPAGNTAGTGAEEAKGNGVQFTKEEKPDIKTKKKTIEEIEEEVKKKRIVSRQTKDAWDAIPKELKLKMANEKATIQLTYKERIVLVSLSDKDTLIKELTKANMAAKTGSLIVMEAVKPMEKKGIALTKEKEQAARRWLAKNLPSLSAEERTQFVDKLARLGNHAGIAWGSYRSGVIQIQRNAPMGTVYHEAFHYVMDMLLSEEERNMLLQITKEELGITDDWAAEERLANDFRRFALDENATGIIGRIKRWFRKLMDKMTRYNRISDVTVNQLLWKINNGAFAEKSDTVENYEETQQTVLREIRNTRIETMRWNQLDGSTREALKEAGLSKESYAKMSLEEQEQYVRCRG